VSLASVHASERTRNYESDIFHYLGEIDANVSSATTVIVSSTTGSFKISDIDNRFEITTDLNILFNMTAGNNVQFSTFIGFTSSTGKKIDYYNSAYRTDVEAFTLAQISDRNFTWSNDEGVELFRAEESGTLLTSNGTIRATTNFSFVNDSVGDKLLLYDTTYKLSISANDLDYYSDDNHKWHNSGLTDAMTLDNAGDLTIKGDFSVSNKIITDVTDIQSAKFNFSQTWIEPDAATLKAKMNPGDMILGSISSVLYLFVLDYNNVMEHHLLTIYASWDTSKDYLPIRVDDELYGAHVHYIS